MLAARRRTHYTLLLSFEAAGQTCARSKHIRRTRRHAVSHLMLTRRSTKKPVGEKQGGGDQAVRYICIFVINTVYDSRTGLASRIRGNLHQNQVVRFARYVLYNGTVRGDIERWKREVASAWRDILCGNIVIMIHVGDGSALDLPLCRKQHPLNDLALHRTPCRRLSFPLTVNPYQEHKAICLLYIDVCQVGSFGGPVVQVSSLTCSPTLAPNFDCK